MVVADEDVLTFEDIEAPKGSTSALVRVVDQPPAVLPTIVLDDVVPFPGAVVPLLLDQAARRDAIHYAKHNSGMLLLINRRPEPHKEPHDALTEAQAKVVEHLVRAQAQEENDEGSGEGPTVEPLFIGKPPKVSPEDTPPVQVAHLHEVGVVARLMRVVRMPDDRLSALLQVFRRAQPQEITGREPTLLMRVNYPVDVAKSESSFQALVRQVRLNLQAFFEAHPSVSDELKVAAMGIEAPAVVADFVGQHLSRDTAERLAFLAELDLTARMRRALEITLRELDLLTVGNRISQEIRDKVEKHQRDFLLREQLKSIRAELGEEKDPAVLALDELRQRLKEAKLPKDAQARADEELRRLSMLPSESPEHNTVRSYLEWIASLPWSVSSPERHDIQKARAILDEDHFGLEEVKDRIIEFLAVHQLNPGKVGTLMCFSGPPGVGKTSLGQSIARALGRQFYRFSVGGMRDEAEIKGHRRTYIGAMPGRIIQGLRQTKVNNPVFMLDELDKIGSDWRGDPSSALLEVLDPAQNRTFADHYLDLPFDLSKVMFIATVNVHTELPAPLRDRLEIIDLPGYIHEEKLQIAQRYLLPRQRAEHGLKRSQLSLGRPALGRIIGAYTHEAGVRELERLVAKVCRKRALMVVTKKKFRPSVSLDAVAKYLGPPKIVDDRLSRSHKPGVAVGLAWTAVGGDVLFIEAAAMPGKGQMKITGQLGEVMDESAKLALSYVRHRGAELGMDPGWFDSHDIHLHFPAGAVKKDGPSAGITVTSALVSLLTGKPLAPSLAMTGEITLRGEVLPVGGIREKVVAARRAGIRTVVLPARNQADVAEIPDIVRQKITFVFAKDFADVMAAAFVPHRAAAQKAKVRARKGARTRLRKQPTALAGKKK
jgi:ATP-dependent Lon protease